VEAVIFIGVQATGKSEFYRQRFFRSHVRVNLDMLKTRHRERLLVAACVEARQPFVIDNTNPSVADRQRYIAESKGAGFAVVGYYFRSSVHEALERNRRRSGPDRVPDRGVLGTYARLELPSRDEGFDQLHFVSIGDDGGFVVETYDESR